MKLQKRFLLIAGAGALAGLAVWAYDYDFFINAGGPATPITDAILRLTHLQGAGFPVTLLWPLIVLIGVGVFFAAVVARFVTAKQ
jgi:hypothetical protein